MPRVPVEHKDIGIAHPFYPGVMDDFIPITEPYRFLDWQPSRMEVFEWELWFTERNVPHVTAQATDGTWTIFKQIFT